MTAARRQSTRWTPQEIDAEERAQRARRVTDTLRTAEERLEETLRLSAFVSELSAGGQHDVPSR